jgi:hypothetical protein
MPVFRKPLPVPPHRKVVRVDSSEEDVVNVSSSSDDSSSSSSNSEADSDDSGFSSDAGNDGDALSSVFRKCRQYATRLAVKISLFAADARMLEPRADASAIIRPQPTRCILSPVAHNIDCAI